MKNIFALIVLIGFNYTISAQNSLQESLNNALNKTEVENTLINFDAHFDGANQNVQLKWSNPLDQKINNFTVEKSADKNNWQEISQINSKQHNNQTIEYFQTDNQPIEGLSYYRIKQQDDKGNEIFSNIIPVKSILGDVDMVNLFPLEESNNKTINISFENLNKENPLLVVLRDIKGVEYYSKVMVNLTEDAMVAIPVDATIPKGDYLIIASSEDQMYSQNIKIQ